MHGIQNTVGDPSLSDTRTIELTVSLRFPAQGSLAEGATWEKAAADLAEWAQDTVLDIFEDGAVEVSVRNKVL